MNQDSLGVRDREVLRLLLERPPMTVAAIAEELRVTKEAVRTRLNRLTEAKLVENVSEGRTHEYVYRPGAFTGISELPPQPSQVEAFRRAARQRFSVHAHKLAVRTIEQSIAGGARPSTFFDVKAVIHPAFSADADGVITAWSPSLVDAFKPWIPRLEDHLGDGMRVFPMSTALEPSLFGELEYDLFRYDWDSDTIDQGLRGRLLVERLLRRLLDDGSVNKFLCCLEARPTHPGEPLRRSFIEISMVFQHSFLGLQSIMPIVSTRVAAYRLNRIMTQSWGDIQHEIRQYSHTLYGVAREISDTLQEAGDTSGELPKAIEEEMSVLRRVADSLKVSGDSFPFPDETPEVEVPIVRIAEDVAAKLGGRFARDHRAKVVLESSVQDPLRYIVISVPFLVRKLFQNFLENAIRHGCPDGGKVSMRVSVVSQRVRFEIVDSGRGLDEQQRNELNKRFATPGLVEPAEAEHLGRRGGMELAMGVVRRLNGTIRFERTAERGLTVLIEIPVQEVERDK